MKKVLIAIMIVALAAGIVYAADQAKKVGEPVTTVATSTGTTVHNVAQGTVDTLNVSKNNPVVTAVETTGQAAEDSVKTATFQKVEKKAPKNG